MLFLAVLAFLLMSVLLMIELFLWGALLALVAVVALILHGAGVLVPVSETVVAVAGIVAVAWAGFKAAKTYGLPLWARYYLPPPKSPPVTPEDAHERYLWANRMGPYSSDP